MSENLASLDDLRSVGRDRIQRIRDIRTESRKWVDGIVDEIMNQDDQFQEVMATKRDLSEHGTSSQRYGVLTLDGEIKNVLSGIFGQSGIFQQDTPLPKDVIERHDAMTKALLGIYPLMDKKIAQHEVQKFLFERR